MRNHKLIDIFLLRILRVRKKELRTFERIRWYEKETIKNGIQGRMGQNGTNKRVKHRMEEVATGRDPIRSYPNLKTPRCGSGVLKSDRSQL